jgi:hypothetical protein
LSYQWHADSALLGDVQKMSSISQAETNATTPFSHLLFLTDQRNPVLSNAGTNGGFGKGRPHSLEAPEVYKAAVVVFLFILAGAAIC